MPDIKDVCNVINFDVPASYTGYKQNSNYVNSELGSILTFIQPENNEQMTAIQTITQKI